MEHLSIGTLLGDSVMLFSFVYVLTVKSCFSLLLYSHNFCVLYFVPSFSSSMLYRVDFLIFQIFSEHVYAKLIS